MNTTPLNSSLMYHVPSPALKPMAAADFLRGSAPEFRSDFESLRSMTAADYSAGAQSSDPDHFRTLIPYAGGNTVELSPDKQHDQLVEQAQKWVAQTFFGTMLKQMRNSPFKSELFSGGRGGEAFGELYDQQMAERMAKGAGNKLVKSLVRKMEANAAYRRQMPSQEVLQRSGEPTTQPQLNEKMTDNPFQKVRIHVAPAFRG
jgi:Rod binding domain-containing protein